MRTTSFAVDGFLTFTGLRYGMANLTPTQTFRVDLTSSVLTFTIGGYWTPEAMRDFLGELAGAAQPLLRRKEPFGALGDLTDFVPQDRETAAAIRSSLLTAQKNGLTRFAIVNPAALVKLQYKRITEGVEVEFFEEKHKAMNWLRESGRNPMPNPIAS